MIENIKKENNELVLRLPLTQRGSHTYGEGEWEVDNLCGLQWGDDFFIAQLSYLDYKDSCQAGMPIIQLDDKEELEEVCKMFDLQIFYYPKCARKDCTQIVTGMFTLDDNNEVICHAHD